MTQAEIDILAEREKQRAKWTTAHDDKHTNPSTLALAASDLILSERPGIPAWILAGSPEWVTSLARSHGERERLVIAAALLIAEVERIDRASTPKQDEPADNRRRCNRHNDCDEAEAHAEAHGMPQPDHCHDDACPDCFGD